MNSFYPLLPMVLADGMELPTYAHDGDAALDLSVTEDIVLRPDEYRMVSSGVAVAIPRGFVGLVVPRSGWGRRGLVFKNTVGVIDSGYRGEIQLPLFNNNPTHVWRHSTGPVFGTEMTELVPNMEGAIHVHKGDRVAQLLIVPIAQVQVLQVDSLDDTERGTDGFGSSGYGRL